VGEEEGESSDELGRRGRKKASATMTSPLLQCSGDDNESTAST